MAQVKGQAKEKESASSVTGVYLHVVEDVIQSVRDDFQSEGVDESVLVELRQLWELKMMQAGAIEGATTQDGAVPGVNRAGNASTQVHDLNVPYEATDEYQTPTMDLLFPPTPQTMTPIVVTPLPTTPQMDAITLQVETPAPALTSTGEPIMFQYIPAGPSESTDRGDGCVEFDVKRGRPAPYMRQPAPWMNQKPRGVDVNIDMNATYEEGQDEGEPGHGQAPVTKDFFTLATGKRKREDLTKSPFLSGNYIPQRDGAGDICPRFEEGPSALGTQEDGECLVEGSGGISSQRLWTLERSHTNNQISFLVEVVSRSDSSHILQCDGMDDDYDDGVAEEDYNEPGDDGPDLKAGVSEFYVTVPPENLQVATDGGSRALTVEPVGDSDGEPPLNEDDDDELDETDQGDEEPQTDHLVLAQFDKVTRSKNKWKCTLKDGIMHLNNKDILFVKATGDFEF